VNLYRDFWTVTHISRVNCAEMARETKTTCKWNF